MPLEAILNFSFAQSPRSRLLHLTEQKGQEISSERCFLQPGHFTAGLVMKKSRKKGSYNKKSAELPLQITITYRYSVAKIPK
jgi:hypothetical protein